MADEKRSGARGSGGSGRGNAASLSDAQVQGIIRSLRRRPVRREAVEAAISGLESLSRERQFMKATLKRRIPSEEDEQMSEEEAVESDDVVVNADRLVGSAKPG